MNRVSSVTHLLVAAAMVGCSGAAAPAPEADAAGNDATDARPAPDALIADADSGPSVDAGATPTDAMSASDAGTPATCGPMTSTFYRFTGALPASNGAVIRCETLDADPAHPHIAGYLGYRVLYRSSTVIHAAGVGSEYPLAVSGQVYVPIATATTPRPVLANTHGTTGVIPACAPSLSGALDTGPLGALSAAVPGAVLVVPDYVGLGVDNGGRAPDAAFSVVDPLSLGTRVSPTATTTHPYLSRTSEGRSTIDLIRAARALPDASLGATPEFFVVGQSQGGHAALSTGEIFAGGYGSELRLLGIIAGAPASALYSTEYLDPQVQHLFTPMVVVGASLEWRDTAGSTALSTPALAAYAHTAAAGCLTGSATLTWVADYDTYLAPSHPLTIASLDTDPALSTALHGNSEGEHATHAPIFIGQSTGDPFVPSQRTDALVAQERALNPTSVTYCVYTGTNLDQGWILRATNHDAFGPMFDGTAGACTAPDGRTTAADPVAFARAVYAAR